MLEIQIDQISYRKKSILSDIFLKVEGPGLYGFFGKNGAGKTTFTKGFALGLDITRVIKSPTYTLIREYTKGRLPLFHMDMYRIEESGGASEIGLEEYFHREGVVMVEWANFIEEELPMNQLIISIEQTSLTTRTITLDAIGEEYEKWLNQFESWWTNERES